MAPQIWSFLKKCREVGKDERQCFEDSYNMDILCWILYQKIYSISTYSLQKEEFLSEITPFLPLKYEYANYLFWIRNFHVAFMTLQGIGFKFFNKIMRSFVFCYSSCIIFNPTNHLWPFCSTITPNQLLDMVLSVSLSIWSFSW